jgi:hypothetical protein
MAELLIEIRYQKFLNFFGIYWLTQGYYDFPIKNIKNTILIGYFESAKYFEIIREQIKKKVKNPVFFTFSDDIEWVRNNMNFGDNTKIYYESGNDPVWEKLRLMYNCKHFVISNSTFSWWAQYLSRNKDKIVIAPSRWRNYDSVLGIYELHWILVEP